MNRLSSLRDLLGRHPTLRDVLLWSIPAVIFGILLRVLFTSALPYAFWGADSRSYFSFAHRLLADHVFSLDEKRRYLYPILMAPVAALPGPPLRWLAVLQHALGVATIWPMAYVVRKTFIAWRLWIIPVTLLFTAFPMFLWYEHELLGETVFFDSLLWAFGGWVAFVNPARAPGAPARFWWFFVPFAAFILTRAAGRFAWPGVLVGLATVAAWRVLTRRQIVALFALICVTLTVGSRKQGAWLLYTATFPLTVLDSPLHADYKQEIRGRVLPLQAHAGAYYLLDTEPFEFLENPATHDGGPLWQALSADVPRKSRVYLDLALEGIKAQPGKFIAFGLQRVVASSNLSGFNRERFTGGYFRGRTEHFYEEGEIDPANRVRFAFGLPAKGAIPPYAQFQERLDPTPGSWRLSFVQQCMSVIGDSLDFVRMPRRGPREERSIEQARPTVLGCWVVLAGVLALCIPRYRPTLGIWTLVAAGYLFGVFLVSQTNVRYFAPAWIVLIPLLALPLDAAAMLLRRMWASVKRVPPENGRSVV